MSIGLAIVRYIIGVSELRTNLKLTVGHLTDDETFKKPFCCCLAALKLTRCNEELKQMLEVLVSSGLADPGGRGHDPLIGPRGVWTEFSRKK